jgi:hypothetical protein
MIHHGVKARPADRPERLAARPERLAARPKRSEERSGPYATSEHRTRTANGSDEMRCHDNVAGDVVNHAG